MVLEDRLALADLVAEYARHCDNRQADAIADLYTEDGGFTIVNRGAEPVEVRGREGMIRGFARLVRYERVFHHLGQHTVEVDGHRATGEAYCLAHHMAAGWRCEFRTLNVDWTETRALNP